jgi:ABC-2 type transport system permease protein/oleandomycin transport system permease protein
MTAATTEPAGVGLAGAGTGAGPHGGPAGVASENPARYAVPDSLAVAWRNVLNLLRTPSVVVFSTLQPAIFVLMFRYVFGGALQGSTPGVPYIDFLMAGIFVQTVVFGAMNTGVGLAMDLQAGMVERFRSLPMARSAVLVGRITADTLRNVFVVALMLGIGFAVGFRLHTNVVALLGAAALLLLFGSAMSWVMALIGLSAGNAEGAQAAAFPITALLVFPSGAFVPTDTMPGWMQAYAEHQPVTAVAEAARALLIGGPTTAKVLAAAAWTAGISLAFAALSVRRYRRAT